MEDKIIKLETEVEQLKNRIIILERLVAFSGKTEMIKLTGKEVYEKF